MIQDDDIQVVNERRFLRSRLVRRGPYLIQMLVYVETPPSFYPVDLIIVFKIYSGFRIVAIIERRSRI